MNMERKHFIHLDTVLLKTNIIKIKKMITGNELIELGFKPSKWFKDAIEHINKNNLTGDEISNYVKSIIPIELPTMPLHENPVKYFVNLTAETDLEKENLAKVCESMDELCRVPVITNACIMPDACPAGPVGTIPVGGIIVAKNSIIPGAHSADICCSLMLTNIGKVDPKTVLDIAMNTTRFGQGGRNREDQFRIPTELLEEIQGNPFLNSERSVRKCREDLGTQGASNHFFYVGISKKTGDITIVSHHGSRSFGALLYKEGMKVAEKFRRKISPETPAINAWIPSDSEEGINYWNALQTVRKWTKQNHICIHDKICETLGVEVKDRFWNEHNFVFKDGDLFYHAKGATPMDNKFMPEDTKYKIIPLNMAQPILIVESCGTSENNLGFSPHGTGRNYSRSEYKRNNAHKTVEQIIEEETNGIDVRFYSGKADMSELPGAYKDANEVKRQIEEFKLATVVDEIIPYGCIMSGHIDENWRKK